MKDDQKYHLHADSYKFNNEQYKEAVAYKHLDADIWDFYFDFEAYGLNPIDKQAKYMIGYGYHVFSINAGLHLDYEYGSEQFCQWLKDNQIDF